MALDSSITFQNVVPGTAEEKPLVSIADMSFRFPLRRYQKEIIELVGIKLERGERELHIVAPPGAGKTIIGLQIISQFKCNSLIISPNTTIQAQWGQKADLFLPPELKAYGTEELIGTHEDRPLKPITLLTYQVLSTPGREQELLEKLAHKSWLEELMRSMSLSQGQAELRIFELMQNNRAAYSREMSRHVSRLRRKLSEVLSLNDVLHENAIGLLQALRRQKFGLVIFDECHHLTDYWAAIMTHLVKQLDGPVVLGLTGTPPEKKSAAQENRYLSLVGDIDYQVPTPALVKEKGLSPFQDLVYFTEPTEKEMEYLQRQHEDFHIVIDELCAMPAPPLENDTDSKYGLQRLSHLSQWVLKRLDLATVKGEENLCEQKPDLYAACLRYAFRQRLRLPQAIKPIAEHQQSPVLEDWIVLLEDYALNFLKVSSDPESHKLYEKIRAAVRKLGFGLTELGMRRQASPVDRVLAFSRSKPQAVAKILETEWQSLGDHLRATIVTDFERMSAMDTKGLQGVLDADSGGAICCLKELLAHPISDMVNPCLVTGSLLLIDKRIKEQFVEACKSYLEKCGHTFDLIAKDWDESTCEISAQSSNWETRLYVGMATSIFERGITKCLVGTRGIFGEGWDSQALNTLVDLTTTTSPVSVKQLRGRSLRLNASDPLAARKVANNWDVACIAPALEKGLNDYLRFVRKHDGYFGICDDGQIECGVGHVHPALSELTGADVFASQEDFNSEMTMRALCREKIYDAWKVGEPYANRALGCVEVSRLRKIALTPPHIRKDLQYQAHVKELRAELAGIWWEYGGLGAFACGMVTLAASGLGFAPALGLAPAVVLLTMAIKKYRLLYAKLKKEVCRPNTQESSLYDIARAVLSSLVQVKLLPRHLSHDLLKVTIRSDGSYRLFLDQVEPEHSQYFARCLKEVLAPVSNQPYLIPKYEYSFPKTETETQSEKVFFKSYLSGRAAPSIGSYHAVPKLLARSEKGREAFQESWNKYVSPGFIVASEEKPELVNKYFGLGPSLAERLLWE